MEKKQIAIIIPTLNEEGNIELLLKRLDFTMQQAGIEYEVIIVDDHSTDKTERVIETLLPLYPMWLYRKKGEKGKAQSLLEGFSSAHYDLVCMIDGDLQYPPEAIPHMLAKMDETNADIIVTNRMERHVSFQRKIMSKTYLLFFGKFLHGFDCDVQSGLKLFKKEILERVFLHPSPWTFDMEFLVKARNAGYHIASTNIIFADRHWGKAKINVLSSSFQLALAAVKVKLSGTDIVPFSKEMTEKEGHGFFYKGNKFIHHTELPSHESAFKRFTNPQILFLGCLLSSVALGLFINWHFTIVLFVSVLTALYFTDLLFNFFLIIRSFSQPSELKISDAMISSIPENMWPSYTIFCPLYQEWEVIPQFVSSMNKLDYPKEKLEVLFLLEEDDRETQEKIKEFNLPDYFHSIIIPHSLPKTKPKALNYGLKKATGELIVIYDAEDVPEPKQLKKAAYVFSKAHEKVICVQAKLNFYNPHQNILTKVFTAEYSLWFDLVLTGLQSIKAPIPLGGTSNIFRTKDLHKIKGWDSFNVTEDCDLGMRLVKKGYQTAIIDSTTYEEANSNLLNWFRQRTRWIKGYIQTYFVHMRNPREFMKNWREPHVITFQLIVGGKVLSMFINPFMWVITISYFVFRATIGHFIESFFLTPIFYMGIFSLTVGNFLYMYYYVIGCAKRDYDSIIKYMFLVPFYWLAMSIAAWMAIYQMVRKPHYWPKTVHGLHLKNKKAVHQASQVIGRTLVDEDLRTYPLENPRLPKTFAY